MDWNGHPGGVELDIKDEGETRTYDLEGYLEAGGHKASASWLVRRMSDWEGEWNDMEDEVQHNEEVVERARDEGARPALVKIPGWLLDDKEDLPDAGHPGELVEIQALVEDYSDDAWRIIATEESTPGTYWYNWCWEFLPKSQTTVTTATGDNFRRGSRFLNEWQRDKIESWEEGLEQIEQEP